MPPSSRRKVGRIFFLTAGMLMMSSCTMPWAPARGTSGITTGPPPAQLLTILNGRLDVQSNPDETLCSVVTFGQTRTAVIWPTGFSAHGKPISIYDASGKRVATSGDKVSLGGGRVMSLPSQPAPGCSGIQQSIEAGPLHSSPEAKAGPTSYDQGQVSNMGELMDSNRSLFGGMWGDRATRVVTIYVSPEADAATVASAEARMLATPATLNRGEHWRVGFMVHGPSLAELDAVLARATTSKAWKDVVGQHLVGWGIDPMHQAVDLMVDALTPAISAAAFAEFASLAVLDTQDGIPIMFG